MVLALMSVPGGNSGASGGEPAYPGIRPDKESLKATVSFLSGIKPSRNYLNIVSLDRSAEYIRAKMSDAGLDVSEQRFEVRGSQYRNIIGSLGPEKAARVIVGAHYDVAGDQPGADDNASGVAGLLEIARILKDHAGGLNYRVDFVAYTLEEPPFYRTGEMGSRIHAKHLHEGDVEVRGMICLESIGYFTDADSSQRYPLGLMRLFYPKQGNFIGVVGNFDSSSLVSEVKEHMKKADIDVRSLSGPSWIPGLDFSDHRNYWKFGYKAVMVTDTAFYRNPNYHRITDNPDTLDYARMGEVVRGVAWAVLNLE